MNPPTACWAAWPAELQLPEGYNEVDQARGRGRGRHDGSHRLRRDALKQNATTEGLAKAGPSLFSVQIVLLGTAAGGGFPQWNCWCPSCRVARQEPSRARRRSQSSAAVSADGRRWFLLNASPDVHAQLERFDAAPPDSALRHVPVEGVVLTDAELDHTLGVVLLREARFLQLWTTDAVERILEADSRILPTTRAFAQVQLRTLGSAEPGPARV